MSESLDAWYQKELAFFRTTVQEFSDRFPKIANRLTLSAAGVKDPHVERLIQAFAYLNARTRLKLDDSFPELADAMLGILYPHMVAPVPSMSVVGFLWRLSNLADRPSWHSQAKRQDAVCGQR